MDILTDNEEYLNMPSEKKFFDAKLLVAVVAGGLIVLLGVRFALHHTFTILGFAILGFGIFIEEMRVRSRNRRIEELETDTSRPKSWRLEKDDPHY